jgi:hypothetical protein
MMAGGEEFDKLEEELEADTGEQRVSRRAPPPEAPA